MEKGKIGRNPGETPYEYAYRLACDALKDADLEERAEKSGALIETRGGENAVITISFLNRNCLIRFPEAAISYQEDGEEIPLWSKILLLHYLGKSQGNPLTGEWINFRQLSGGDTYYPAFIKRSQKPLLDFFAGRLDLLEEVVRELGGRKGSEGDRSVIIPALPRVPIALIFWSGDEEFQPEARILFDATIPTYLSTEDVAVLAQQTVSGLIKCAKSKG